ncbi:DUF2314 domain-containing protein [Mollicutes bacterium LVI A0039]|nr:DUF2314 domain-containing protein [Mollicutes bacterium LVI A0039]
MLKLFKKSKPIEPQKVYDTYCEDLYEELETAKPSKMVGFSSADFDFSIENIANRLEANESVTDVIIDNKQNSLAVFTNYSGTEEQIILNCYSFNPNLANFIKGSTSIKNGNFGVDVEILDQALASDYYIYSTMVFNKENPFASYKTQAYIMSIAIDVAMLFDESSRKILNPSFISFILERDLKSFVKNLFSIVILNNGWTYTVGLGRFYLKDYELNNVKLSVGVYNVLEMEVLKQFEFGCIKSGTTQEFSEDIFVTFVDIEHATNFLSPKLIGKPDFRCEEFMIDYQTLLYTSTLEFELEHIEKELINSKFNPDGIQKIPTAVTENIHQAVIKTEEYFHNEMIANGLYKLLTVKFALKTQDEIEYIWGRIVNIENSVFEIELLNQPVYDSTLKIGSVVKTSYSQIIDWVILEDIPFNLYPYNLYVLENPRFAAYIDNLKLN